MIWKTIYIYIYIYIYINLFYILLLKTGVFTTTKHAQDRKVMKSVTGKSVT